jgi:hypothetical protein
VVKISDPSGHSVDCGVGDPYCHAGTLDVKQRALDTATEIQGGSSTRYWGALTRQEQLILSEAGWSEGDYNAFARGGDAVPADMWHDPLTYVLVAVGGFKLAGSLGKIGSAAAATEFANEVQTGNNTVYRSVENGVTRYIGITNDFARRAAEHLNQKGWRIEPIQGLENLSRYDARAVEQVLIENFGLENLYNRINSIASTNPIYQEAINRGKEILEQIGHFIAE